MAPSQELEKQAGSQGDEKPAVEDQYADAKNWSLNRWAWELVAQFAG